VLAPGMEYDPWRHLQSPTRIRLLSDGFIKRLIWLLLGEDAADVADVAFVAWSLADVPMLEANECQEELHNLAQRPGPLLFFEQPPPAAD